MAVFEKMDDVSNCTMADIALNYPQAIRILNRYELDYSCKGQSSFLQACQKAKLDPGKVWEEIQNELPFHGPESSQKFDTWNVPLLIDFIVRNHHEFIRVTIPRITELLAKVVSSHASEFPELEEVKHHFELLAEELTLHMPEEEEILFPAIRRIATREFFTVKSPLVSNIRNSVAFMENEHENSARIVKAIRHVTNHYTLPANASFILQTTYRLLAEFDDDLMQHIHLENNILFQKVKAES